MLYTIVPMSEIFKQEIAEPSYSVENGVILEKRPDAAGKQAVCRVITSDLRVYLSKPYETLPF